MTIETRLCNLEGGLLGGGVTAEEALHNAIVLRVVRRLTDGELDTLTGLYESGEPDPSKWTPAQLAVTDRFERLYQDEEPNGLTKPAGPVPVKKENASDGS